MSDIHTLSGAYAVDAVDQVERTRFERHLQTCPDCRVEVDSLRETAALLSSLEELTAPPPGLRDRVLAEIATVRPLPPVIGTGHDIAPSQGRPAAPPRIPRPRRYRGMGLIGLVAAASVAVAGIGAAVWQPWRIDAPEQGPGQTLTATDRVLTAPDAREVSLTLGEAEATVVHSRSVGRAVLITKRMPPAPAGKVYELWFQTPEGEMEPAGIMPRAEDQTVLLEGDGSEAEAVAITVEPAGGSSAPSSAPIAVFEL